MADDARRFLPLKPEVFHILLALRENVRHGYGIIQDVERASGGTVLLQTGALYRELKRLLHDGLIAETAAPAEAEDHDPRRRYYRVTAFGVKVAAAEAERLAALVATARRLRLTGSPRTA
ncbi:MAG TPA: helix-turn-helix transcriptional regulator [Gemmatimonadaceae bacterium]|nr:helix-turn-helix transcriptional regulator [Gemmatimonadaceae bacterium]